LSIENFVEGFKVSKRFCSVACKASFKAIDSTSTDILTDYSLVLDKAGLLSSGKMARYMNALTVVDLQKNTGLITNDVNTLLYAVINADLNSDAVCSVMLDSILTIFGPVIGSINNIARMYAKIKILRTRATFLPRKKEYPDLNLQNT
jgi:hypothetical protein